MVKRHAPEPPPTPASAAEERGQDQPAYDIARQIGDRLRTMFDGVLTEPVPERFRRLLQELEQRASSEARGTDAPEADAPASGPATKPPASS
jgi:anti-sigma factor NepR-like protein